MAFSFKTLTGIDKQKKKEKSNHIAIAGNIGSGKTTLTKMLCKEFKWIPLFEEVDNNPYMHDFYDDMARWSFNLQIHFLSERFKKLYEIKHFDSLVVQDRTIYEDVFIFATNLKEMGLMSARDFATYYAHFEIMNKMITPPDLIIYLKASLPLLVEQIQKRGRKYEENINLSYLKRLNNYYEKWVENYNIGNIITIDVDKIRFENDENKFGDLISKLQGEINGLF